MVAPRSSQARRWGNIIRLPLHNACWSTLPGPTRDRQNIEEPMPLPRNGQNKKSQNPLKKQGGFFGPKNAQAGPKKTQETQETMDFGPKMLRKTQQGSVQETQEMPKRWTLAQNAQETWNARILAPKMLRNPGNNGKCSLNSKNAWIVAPKMLRKPRKRYVAPNKETRTLAPKMRRKPRNRWTLTLKPGNGDHGPHEQWTLAKDQERLSTFVPACALWRRAQKSGN